MRKATLLLATLLLFALAGTASADCISCVDPCTGPYGDNYMCFNDGEGEFGGCTNRPNCRGCLGWINQDCIWLGATELEPEAVKPLLGVQRVTAVAVRHDATPVRQTPPYQIALAH